MKRILKITFFFLIAALNANANEITMLSYNILGHSYNSYTWSQRQALVFSNIDQFNPNIIGIQEVTNGNSPEDYYNDVRNRYQDSYHIVRSAQSTANLLLIEKQKYQLVQSSSYDFSSIDNRYFVWAKINEISTGDQIFVVNLHLDHEDSLGNFLAVQEMMNHIYNDLNIRNTPIAILGDFNAAVGSNTIKYLINDANYLSGATYPSGFRRLHDSHCADMSAHCNSVTAVGANLSRIDFIFSSNDLVVEATEVFGDQTYTNPDPNSHHVCYRPNQTPRVICPSDHLAVLTKFKLKKISHLINYDDYIIPIVN